MGREEKELVAVSTMETTDIVRVLTNDSSRRITLANLLTAGQDVLTALGFLTTGNISSSLSNVSLITRASTNYNLTIAEDTVLCDVSGASFGINLPAAADAWDSDNDKGQKFTIKLELIDSTNQVTLTPSGSETIDGASDYDLIGPNKVFATIISDGSNWHVIGG
jgi:hypothetical protein